MTSGGLVGVALPGPSRRYRQHENVAKRTSDRPPSPVPVAARPCPEILVRVEYVQRPVCARRSCPAAATQRGGVMMSCRPP